jgi:hypothetical protein
MRAFRAKNPLWQRGSNLKTKFGITLEQFDAMFSAQGNLCAICRTDSPGHNGWCVDHCHATQKVRGVLCRHCNLLLGYARDDIAVLAASAAYLHKQFEAVNG